MYLSSESKGADQLICAFFLAYAKSSFSYDAAHIYAITRNSYNQNLIFALKTNLEIT